jgi:hypothetical protein
MAYEGQQICVPGLVSGADLSAAGCAYKFVKFSTAPAVVLCDALTDQPIGVLQAPTPTSALGQPVQVCMLGITKLQGDGVLTVGSLIGVNISGRGVAILWGTDTTQFALGTVLNRDAATPAGCLLTAVVNCINPPLAVTSL